MMETPNEGEYMERVTGYIALLQETLNQLPRETIAHVIDLLHSAR